MRKYGFEPYFKMDRNDQICTLQNVEPFLCTNKTKTPFHGRAVSQLDFITRINN